MVHFKKFSLHTSHDVQYRHHSIFWYRPYMQSAEQIQVFVCHYRQDPIQQLYIPDGCG